MIIKKIQLHNFRRFSDLTIDLSQLKKSPKLVLLIGPNGSGKTCVFDAFEAVSSRRKGEMNATQKIDYYVKWAEVSDYKVTVSYEDEYNGQFGNWIRNKYEIKNEVPLNAFYGRASLRQVPEVNKTSLGTSDVDFNKDTDRPQKYIDRDIRFENDIEHIIGKILNELFTSSGEVKTGEIRKKYIDPINEAFNRIFGFENGITLQLTSLKPPLEGKPAEILFKKGVSEFHYNHLSAGEKEIFNILLNLLARGDHYQNTIYFFDEIDLHLNTSLQYRFLQEITENWIPNNCQLWTASHSLGFIEYANDSEQAAIIDFDELDFDQVQILTPEPKDRYEIFEIAVSRDQLDKLMKDKEIIFSENKDTVYFNELGIDNTVFFRGNDKRDVFYKTLNMNYKGVVDRDYLTDLEIDNIEATYPNLKLLRYYSIENYLLHPENLQEYLENQEAEFNSQRYVQKITECKNDIKDIIIYKIQESRRSYPFFRDKDHENQLDSKMESGQKIVEMLNTDDFETYYKVFPIKDFCKQIEERQNLDFKELAKTKWFKRKIEEIIK